MKDSDSMAVSKAGRSKRRGAVGLLAQFTRSPLVTLQLSFLIDADGCKFPF